jgi:plasmid stabilization system protein ParE
MNDAYEVIWSHVAENDLRNIIEFIAEDSPANASKVFKNIKRKAANLCVLPERGRIVQELRDQGILQYRELIISPWRVIYRIAKKNVYVLSIMDSRQNIEDILLKRLINSKL